MTNLFREHTDWHGAEEAYRADKLRLLDLPGVRTRVINGRDPGAAAARTRHGRARPYERDRSTACPAAGTSSTAASPCAASRCVARGELPLRGEHNALNLCGALTALEALGIDAAAAGVACTASSRWRIALEPVAERDGVLWVNDSISTTPESDAGGARELPRSRDRPDRRRSGPRSGLHGSSAAPWPMPARASSACHRPARACWPRPRDAGTPSARAIEAPDLREAVARARELARPGSVVLLSPAAPSYDNYRDFEERGERFRALATC